MALRAIRLRESTPGWPPLPANIPGAPETANAKLARTVRGCAASSADEAEFVRRLRGARLKVKPRDAASAGADGQAAVAGYSVALRPPKGSAPLCYGGGRLARDLTLPRLRADWPDTPAHAAAARARVAVGQTQSGARRDRWP